MLYNVSFLNFRTTVLLTHSAKCILWCSLLLSPARSIEGWWLCCVDNDSAQQWFAVSSADRQHSRTQQWGQLTVTGWRPRPGPVEDRGQQGPHCSRGARHKLLALFWLVPFIPVLSREDSLTLEPRAQSHCPFYFGPTLPSPMFPLPLSQLG